MTHETRVGGEIKEQWEALGPADALEAKPLDDEEIGAEDPEDEEEKEEIDEDLALRDEENEY